MGYGSIDRWAERERESPVVFHVQLSLRSRLHSERSGFIQCLAQSLDSVDVALSPGDREKGNILGGGRLKAKPSLRSQIGQNDRRERDAGHFKAPEKRPKKRKDEMRERESCYQGRTTYRKIQIRTCFSRDFW